jgi:hypothetical protein
MARGTPLTLTDSFSWDSASACVAENKYPALTRCWKDLEKLFMSDPAFEDGVFVQSWALMDFPFGPERQTALDYFEELLKGTEAGPRVQGFINEARKSRLGLYQDAGRTKTVANFRELISPLEDEGDDARPDQRIAERGARSPLLLGEVHVRLAVGGGGAEEGHVVRGMEELPVGVEDLLVLVAADLAAAEHGPLCGELAAHGQVEVEERRAEERLPGRDGEELLSAHRVG